MIAPDCLPENQARLTGHKWCSDATCECAHHLIRCAACNGWGYTQEADPRRDDDREHLVSCPDCAGSGRAADSITFNELGLPNA